MTQEEMAEKLTLVRVDGRDEQVATSTVSGWERAVTTPGPEWSRPIAAVLNVEPDELPDLLAVSGEPDTSSAEITDEVTPTITAMWAMLDGFRTADRKVGGGVLYGPVTRYLKHEVAPYLVDPFGQAAESHLFAVAASFTEAAGWMAYDAGREDPARLHFNRAYRLASAAGDPALVANVCASMSYLAGQLSWAADAVRLADAGLERSQPEGGRLVARLLAMRAHGLALQGDRQRCSAALQDAEAALSIGNGEPMPDWITPFDEASLASETATCLRRLGDITAAERWARRAIELRGSDRVRSQAFAQIMLAQILVDADRIDEAAVLGQAACKASRSLTSTRVMGRLDGLRQLLNGHETQPEVATFLAQLAEAYEAAPSSPGETTWPI